MGENKGSSDKQGANPGERMVKELNLTEEQAAKFKANREALMAKTKETHEANKVKKEKMATEHILRPTKNIPFLKTLNLL